MPRRVNLVLSCDAKHAHREQPVHTFSEGGYVANRHAASAAGWTITGLGKVYCPQCKGRARVIVATEGNAKLPV